MSLSNYAENLLLDWLLNSGSGTQPSAWYVALHDGDPGDDGSTNEITTAEDTSYVRKAITFGSASSGQTLSDSAVTWTAGTVASSFDVTYVSIWDAVSGGNCLATGALTVTKTISTGGVLTFEIGEVVANLD